MVFDLASWIECAVFAILTVASGVVFGCAHGEIDCGLGPVHADGKAHFVASFVTSKRWFRLVFCVVHAMGDNYG